jgi:hypothetical protein
MASQLFPQELLADADAHESFSRSEALSSSLPILTYAHQFVVHDLRPYPLEQLQMPRNLINNTFRRRSNPQHRGTPTRDLCPPRVVDDVCDEPQTECLRL